jgi:tetratricopeptide (TPR) repeat protein
VTKKAKRILKVFAGLVLGLALVLLLSVLWLTRPPTTQLIDASGQELTAGGGLEEEDGVLGGSLFAEVQALIGRKEFPAAKERLLQIVEESDRDGEACVLLCEVFRELKEADTAVDYGLKAVRLLPNSAEAHLSYAKALALQIFSDMQSLGGMLAAMGRMGPFREALERVIELNPEDTDARTMLVFYNMAPKPMGDIDRAIELSYEVEKRDPVGGKRLLAACYHRKEETERAIALLVAGIEEYPNESGLHVSLADIYADEKRFDAADAEYEAARRGGKGEAYYRSLYGQARMRVQNEYEPERAIALLDAFIAGEPGGENMPSAAHACWRKGNALEQLGRKKEAREAYEEGLRRDPAFKLAEKALEGLKD